MISIQMSDVPEIHSDLLIRNSLGQMDIMVIMCVSKETQLHRSQSQANVKSKATQSQTQRTTGDQCSIRGRAAARHGWL